MKNIGKRKILKFVIFVLCILIFANVFLAVIGWLLTYFVLNVNATVLNEFYIYQSSQKLLVNFAFIN